MRPVMRTANGVRVAALLALGSFGLHQLRYLSVFAGSPPAELAHRGHGYLSDLLPALAVLVMAACLATILRGTEGAAPVESRFGRRAGLFSLAILAIYLSQESLESLASTGRPASDAFLVAGRGWIAIPLALLIGAAIALVARAVEGLERAIAVVHTTDRVRRRPPAIRGRALAAHSGGRLSAPLAFGLARRPPPIAPA